MAASRVRTNHIRLHRLHREELAAGHLLQRCSVEHIVHALHGIVQCALVTHVADVELNLVGHLWHTCLEVMTHIILFLLIAGEDADLTDIGTKEAIKNGVSETARSACYQQDFVFKDTHNLYLRFLEVSSDQMSSERFTIYYFGFTILTSTSARRGRNKIATCR